MSRILIIEDEIINQMILKQGLEQQGYEVEVASDGKTGLVLAEIFLPALIVCDWIMPEMNGLEVCQHIKASPTLSDTFFILLTAKSGVQDRIEGLDSGADEFLNKPVQSVELQARVRAGLRIYQAQQELRQLASALQAQRNKLDLELAQAANYVTSLLPQALSGQVEVEAKFFPSQQLGGDCFDFYWLDHDHLVFYLLDVSGHGLGAALPSVSMQQVLRSQSLPNTNFQDPQSVFQSLNHIFRMSEQNPRFFSIWYGVYCLSQATLTYASAGHPAAVFVNPTGQPQCLGQEGQFPIGMFTDSRYAVDQTIVEAGSTLYLFSDGLYELKQSDGSLWGYQALCQLLSCQHQSTRRPSLSQIIAAIRQLNSGPLFEDDCSIIQAFFD